MAGPTALPRRRDADAAVELARDRERRDVRRAEASAARERVADRRRERREPERGILLGPARPRDSCAR